MTSVMQNFLFAGLFLAGSAFGADARIEPSDGMLPDGETAVVIAVAIFKPIFGAEKIESQRPFHADLNGEVWHVYGSLPVGWLGGVAEAELSRKDGRVIRVWHSK
jgi:NTF2 fold immunity protein